MARCRSATMSLALKMRRAVEAASSREWSSTMLRISASSPPASGQWVMSACHTSFGRSASNRRHEERGRLCGCGVTKPRRDKIRQIVATAGDGPRPLAQMPGDSLRPRVMPRLSQLLTQRHDRVLSDLAGPARAGVRAAGPRPERRLTSARSGLPGSGPTGATPRSGATALLDRPSSTTAVITTRAIDIAHHPAHQDAKGPEHPRTTSPSTKPDYISRNLAVVLVLQRHLASIHRVNCVIAFRLLACGS